MSPPKIGMPNPASQYCIEQGGQLEIRNEANGQVGYCKLPNGKVVEEWELLEQINLNAMRKRLRN